MELSDEQRHVERRLTSILSRMNKIIIIFVIVLLGLLVSTITLAVQRSSSDPSAQNAELKAQNQRLILQNKQTDQKIGQLDEENIALQQSISELDADVDATGKQIDELQAKIKQNCDITMQKLFFNHSNVNTFALSIPQTKGKGLPAIVFLNLTGNTLTTFCQNSLPDLQIIDLKNNKLQNLTNNYLPNLNELDLYEVGKIQQFSNNLLPLVTALNFTNHPLSSFKGNILPQMKSLILDTTNITVLQGCIFLSLENISSKKTSLSTLSKNTFPKLADFDFRSITKMVGNDLGAIASITFQQSSSKQVRIFEQNKLPEITQLQFYSVSYDMATLTTNYMPQLASFTFGGGLLTNFQYYPQLRLLSKMKLDSVIIEAFSNHEYSNMKELYLSYTYLKEFSNNKFPALQRLIITYADLPDICNRNLMLSLKYLYIYNVSSIISNNSCLAKLQALEYLSVSYPTLDKFQNYCLPQLESLILRSTYAMQKHMPSFKNNTLPKLNKLQINVETQVELHAYQEQLSSLLLSGPISNFSAYIFPKLKEFSLLVTVFSNFTSNDFPVLEKLSLSGLYFSLAHNNYGLPLSSLSIQKGLGDIIIDYSLERSLESLEIIDTNMISFNNHSMPKLTNLIITSANLTAFNNNTLPNAIRIILNNNQLSTIGCHQKVSQIDLRYNMFTDSSVDEIIRCNLRLLTWLDVRDNRFTDPSKVYEKLRNKYPFIQIFI